MTYYKSSGPFTIPVFTICTSNEGKLNGIRYVAGDIVHKILGIYDLHLVYGKEQFMTFGIDEIDPVPFFDFLESVEHGAGVLISVAKDGGIAHISGYYGFLIDPESIP